MPRRLKKGIAFCLDRFGYEIRRKSVESAARRASHFENCLHLLLGTAWTLNIVQVGANDGAINDPLYSFVSRFPERVRLILVEPQSQLIPHLAENYRFLSTKYIFNGAVGSDQTLELHSIREECWDDLVVPYAKSNGWPAYRAPTGVTSGDYDHVATWLSQHYHGRRPISELIETISVEALDVQSLLNRANLFSGVDVLQVDVEGYDDRVIYASNIAELRPFLINFELSHLEQARASCLINFLVNHGYAVSPHGDDGLAIRTVPVLSR
jgi:FkbM family methyltransferase